MRGQRLLLLSVVLVLGCQYDPHTGRYTTAKPVAKSLAGRYVLSEQHLNSEDAAALRGRECVIDLRADGTFSAMNVPIWELGPKSDRLADRLASSHGTWRIERVGQIDGGWFGVKDHWGVYFDSSPTMLEPVGLMGAKEPYGLIYTIGDPDSGEAIMLEREP
jgi:hypothetical protein